ncbi:MAG: KPN_02809 family neutral zinc metallopeptidase [Burkholderiales bacterium]
MRWRGRRQSNNVEDRRGLRPGGLALGGGGALIVVILALLFGADPRQLLEQLQTQGPAVATSPTARTTGAPGATDATGDLSAVAPAPDGTSPAARPDDERAQFVSVVLAETEDVWRDQFKRLGRIYEEPKLVLFSDEVRSACGLTDAAVGPFYCPGDHKVYIDLAFYEVLRRKLGAPGDFAQAYVIAHEVGHHVQNVLGLAAPVRELRGKLSDAEFNQILVRLELQADFFAGLWAHYAARTANLLEAGDIEEALNAASAIGDDRLQMQSQGRVVPDAFTHGTAAQRVRWFRRGYETGDFRQGDTFGAEQL